ncbi:1-(5-phosphoribosyl)-5-[(5-phosphoribosylamino)methylideneamino]imidazole-4-carboxamide isomerase [Novispirillum sp. DQ9]|uniref:1-(5-phosphoribosyl)-5-[(5- phosphoribosylamino)methylideneamino]imidazole-4- carboxamide isomerase n=1 Tax=Novispirillum sp. DQ9 TaxID=3398612 RepID=UPI003C7DA15F
MILFPAIDLKEGACVRLYKGEMDQATVFNESPADQAARFKAAGCRWLHVVDLDGAFAGRPANAHAVEAILEALRGTGAEPPVPVQLGGGIRDHATIDQWLDKGVRRVILGTVALRDPGLVKEACRRHPGRIAVGIDARNGMVAVEGWAETSDISALDLALKFEDAGVAAIIYTDIDRDGALTGVNVEATAALAEKLTTPVIASGGVSGLDDLRALKARTGSGIGGVISGRALYDGRLDLAEALAVLDA